MVEISCHGSDCDLLKYQLTLAATGLTGCGLEQRVDVTSAADVVCGSEGGSAPASEVIRTDYKCTKTLTDRGRDMIYPSVEER